VVGNSLSHLLGKFAFLTNRHLQWGNTVIAGVGAVLTEAFAVLIGKITAQTEVSACA